MPTYQIVEVQISECLKGFIWETYIGDIIFYKNRGLKTIELCKENCRKFLNKHFPDFEPEFI